MDAEISPSQEAREANVLSLLLRAPGNHHTSTFEQGDQTRIFYRFMRINHVERAAKFVSCPLGQGKRCLGLLRQVPQPSRLRKFGSPTKHHLLPTILKHTNPLAVFLFRSGYQIVLIRNTDFHVSGSVQSNSRKGRQLLCKAILTIGRVGEIYDCASVLTAP